MSLSTNNLVMAGKVITIEPSRIGGTRMYCFFFSISIANFLGICAQWTWLKSIYEDTVHSLNDESWNIFRHLQKKIFFSKIFGCANGSSDSLLE